MSYEFNLPNFHVETASERRMYAYLYQMVQQLNWAMKHIQGEENTVYLARENGKVIRQEKGSSLTAENFAQIKSLIIKSGDIVNAYYDSINARLQGVYVAQSDFGVYAEETDLKLEANSAGITQNYSNLQEMSGKLTAEQEEQSQLSQGLASLREELSGLHSQLTKTNAYIRTGVIDEDENGLPVYGLEIGQTNEVNGQEVFNKYARFSSSRLSFYDQNDTEVAYISDYKLYITNVHITGTLTVGRYEIETSDGLAFRWIGGED